MAFDDVICRGLPERLAGLEFQIELQERLLEDPELTPAEKARIRLQIRRFA